MIIDTIKSLVVVKTNVESLKEYLDSNQLTLQDFLSFTEKRNLRDLKYLVKNFN